MVSFTKDTLIIEVCTGSENPVDFWLQLQQQLIHLNESQSDDLRINHFQVNDLLTSLIPADAEEFHELCTQTMLLSKK